MKKTILATLTIVLAIALMACDNDNTGGGGGTQQTATVGGIPVKGQGVTTQQFNTAVANINTAYGHLGDAHKINWNARITSIQIVSGSTVTSTGTVLKVGASASDEAILEKIIGIVAAQIQPKTAPGVILAFQSPDWNFQSANGGFQSANGGFQSPNGGFQSPNGGFQS